jgi:uncharacterized protein YjcR
MKTTLKTSKKHIIIEAMTTQEVAEKYGVSGKTVRVWCLANGVKRKLGKQGVMEYEMTDKDIEKFENRKPKGRPKKKQPSNRNK